MIMMYLNLQREYLEYTPSGSVEHYNEEPGQVWLQRMIEHFPYFVWLNPVAKSEWKYTQSIGMIQNIMKNRMFPLTIRGIEAAVERSEEHTSELQSRPHLVCRLLLETKKKKR